MEHAVHLMMEQRMLDDCIDHGKRGTGRGYAQRSVNNRLRYMHRLAYAEKLGVDESKLVGVVRHICDNPRCINPQHLILGSHKDNSQDMIGRCRANPPVGVRAATCKLTEDQVHVIRVAEGKQKDIAAQFGITPSQVSRIRGGKRWQHL